GLIIVDEEQRFGVAQKERLKKLKAQIDVLTLSATPIPRTLNMSLVGIRDLSIIETPPKDRLSIQTGVVRFSNQIIRSAIDLELKRKGQVFFLHNRVETIHAMAQNLQRIIPEARIAVGHGQMREDELEKVMLDFLRYSYDVLVCTTIIENGLDIPRANTIIINRADRFGLSELYQLRGRVGRSNRRAYAYLLVADEGGLTEDARKRLAAIKEFSDLGSGFRLAALDLEIRGAGNLLGGEQSGHIDAVGFELYVKLLEQAIRELKGEPETAKVHTTIDLRLDIQIPEHYIDDPNTRLWLYKRLSTVSEEGRLDVLRDEVIDRFGRYPRAVANLFEYGRLRLIAERIKLTSIERKGTQVRLKFRDDTPLTPETAVRFVQSRSGTSFSADGSLIASIDGGSPMEILQQVSAVLGWLTDAL
ncbi:MAG: TRCF domain-containing protein, partial [Acidobacteriota bacterium]